MVCTPAYSSPSTVIFKKKKKKQPSIQETYKSPIYIQIPFYLQRPFLQHRNMQQVTFLLCTDKILKQIENKANTPSFLSPSFLKKQNFVLEVVLE